jgi:hypothetical protein
VPRPTRPIKRRNRTLLLVLTLAMAGRALAGHPMLSEDTGTQGSNNYELELGYDLSRSDGNRTFLFQPQFSYGVTPALDLILQPSYLTSRGPGDARAHGFGDTNLDFKWRFFGSAPLTVGVRAGLELATAQQGLGLPRDRVSPHGILVATLDVAPFGVDFNLGYANAPGDVTHRSDLFHASVGAQYALNEKLFLVSDTSLDSNPDATQAQYMLVTLVGAIYTVRPGFDIDAGYRAGLNSGSTRNQWLLGFTVRGAL